MGSHWRKPREDGMTDYRVNVQAEGRHAYDIVIKDHFYGLLEELPRLSCQTRKVCIVTDKKVASIYLQEVFELVQGLCGALKVFVFEEGEARKNLDTVSRLYEFLIRNHYDRKDLLLALGGGVTGDLTGFAAATYLRGIDFIQVPTSLLSQVDSSIGGKTGVDFQGHKNMVGAFYMPKLVYINISTLTTLSDREYRSGLGEVIKHGLIRDADYYRWILDNRAGILSRDPETMAHMVEGSVRIKKEVVEEDPREQGIRALLNYGHTFGHAIEKEMNFALTHGECVGIGSVLATALSAARGLISMEEYEQIRQLFQSLNFPDLPDSLSEDQVIKEMKHDKKMEQGIISFILLNRIGQAGIFRDVTEEEMRRFIEGSLARHKVPRYISFVDSFPMNAAGKILKYKMREEAARDLGLSDQ